MMLLRRSLAKLFTLPLVTLLPLPAKIEAPEPSIPEKIEKPKSIADIECRLAV